MSKQTIFLAIAAFAIGGIVMTVLLRQSSAPTDTTPLTDTTPPSEVRDGPPKIPPSTPPSEKKMAFSEFIKKGSGSYKCTVRQSTQGVDTSGVTYVSGGMIRGEYQAQMNGTAVGVTNMIARDGYTYTWTSMMPTMGFKAKVVEGTGDTDAPTSASYSFNAEQIGEYDCQPWAVDASVFALPKDVTWTEMQ